MIYFGIVGASVFFACLAAWSSHRQMFFAFSFLTLLTFTIPAVIRYGVGCDYLGVYSTSIEQIAAGMVTDQELSFRMVVEFVLDNLPSEHYVFVIYSLLTYLVAWMSFPRKGFNYAIAAYLLMYYAFTLSGIRQGLALSFILCVLLFYFKRCWLLSFAMVAIATFWHFSAVIVVPLVVAANLCAQRRLVWFPFAIAVLAVVFWKIDFSGVVLHLVAVTPYARYLEAANGEVLNAARVSSGLGYLIPAVMFFMLSTVLVTHRNGRRIAKTIGVLCGFAVLFYAVSIHIDVFNRFSIVANAAIPFAIAMLARLQRSVKDRICLVFAVSCMIALFCKEVISDANYGITPYQTVFDVGIELW